MAEVKLTNLSPDDRKKVLNEVLAALSKLDVETSSAAASSTAPDDTPISAAWSIINYKCQAR